MCNSLRTARVDTRFEYQQIWGSAGRLPAFYFFFPFFCLVVYNVKAWRFEFREFVQYCIEIKILILYSSIGL